MGKRVKKNLAVRIVDDLFRHDLFTRWMGVKRMKVKAGTCVLRMRVRKEMLNGFAIAHGGIAFSLADSALAFASNSRGKKSVSIETSISLLEAVKEGDVLTAEANEVARSNKIGIYRVTVTNQHNKKVALFKGTVYRTGKEWYGE